MDRHSLQRARIRGLGRGRGTLCTHLPQLAKHEAASKVAFREQRVVSPAHEAQIVCGGRASARVRYVVMMHLEPATRRAAPTLRADERAPPASARIHLPQHGARNVARKPRLLCAQSLQSTHLVDARGCSARRVDSRGCGDQRVDMLL